MYCKVAPIRRFPRKAEPFDYAVPDGMSVEVGDFVMAPLKGRAIEGLVTKVMESTAVPRVRPLIDPSERTSLTGAQVAFYERVARTTYQSFGSVLHASIPPLLKRKTQVSEPNVAPLNVSLTKSDAQEITRLVGALSQGVVQHIATPHDAFQLAFVAVMARKHESLLVICPEVHIMHQVASSIAHVGKHVTLYGDTMNKTEALRGFEAIQSGDSIVVGTRIAALAPVSPETPIIIVGSGDDEHYQEEQNPHYDVRTCARSWNELQKNPVSMLDVFPRVEDGPITDDLWRHPPVRLVDMKKASKVADPYMISADAVACIKAHLTESTRVLVYYNRKGDARSVQCRSCGTTVTCTQCQTPGRVHNDALFCGACKRSGAIPEICPNCKGAALTRKGLGNTAIAAMFTQAFPGAPVHVYEAGDALPKTGIVICTRAVLSALNFSKPTFAALIVLQADHAFIHRSFRSMEQAGRLLRRLCGLAISANVPLIVQSWVPDVVSSLLGSTKAWHGLERDVRRFASYPPVKDLILVRSKQPEGRFEIYAENTTDCRYSDLWLAKKVDPGEVVEAFQTWPQSCDIRPNPGTFPIL